MRFVLVENWGLGYLMRLLKSSFSDKKSDRTNTPVLNSAGPNTSKVNLIPNSFA